MSDFLDVLALNHEQQRVERTEDALKLKLVRELTSEDLPALASNLQPLTTRKPLERLRANHHRIARMLADGVKHAEVAAVTGHSASYVSTLAGDPAMRDLVAYYESQKEPLYLSMHQKLAHLGETSVEALQELVDAHLEAEVGDKARMPAKMLLEIASAALDRSSAPSKAGGAGSGQPVMNFNLRFMAAQSGTAAGPVAGPVIEGTATVVEGEEDQS